MDEKIPYPDQSAKKEEAPVSRLTLNFAGPGSAEFGLQFENVTPAQILAAAAWLDWYARNQFDQIAAQAMAQAPKLVVPPGVAIRGQMRH